MTYIDDAMNEGAFEPEPKPKRCKMHRYDATQKQTAIDGRVDLECPHCGVVTIEDFGGPGERRLPNIRY